MRYWKSLVVLAILMLGTLLVFWQSALAKPPEKPGNPALQQCLSEVAALQAEIADLNNLVNQLQSQALVPKTGQTKVWLDGDDGDLQIGVPWPNPRFTDKSDGTVIDNLTGLMWTKSAGLYAGRTTLSNALTSCSSCNEGGYTDWRLPNVRELQSLIDYGGEQYDKLPAGHPFTGPFAPGGWWYYWSSTTHGVESAYCISFENGFMWSMSGCNVWCVRGGN